MRGELNTRNDSFLRGGPMSNITAPSTPGTASTNRQHPPVYQRMHSNDSGPSDKDGGRVSE